MSGTAAQEQPGPRARDAKPDWIDPELATLTQDRFSDPAWIYERKLDGERCIARRDGDTLRLMTRNQKLVTSTYPELAEALMAQPASDFIVDGEVVAFQDGQTKFEQLQQRMQVASPSPQLIQAVPVQYYLFDVLYADGHDLRPLPQLERKDRLRELLSFADPLRFTEHRVGDGVAYYQEACRQGWEGLIAKRASAPYRSGRTKDWLKFKCVNAQEFVIGGYTDPQGSRTGLGALLLGYYDGDGNLVYAGKVGTGFDTRMLRLLHGELAPLERDKPPFTKGDLPRAAGVHWAEPRLVAQIGFSEWTTAGQLRHPRFEGLRRDKSPEEVVREVPQGNG
jgi:bifunctional non-homologous end joining protein LigD